MKPKTIDEVCGKEKGFFKKFINQKAEYLQQNEAKRKSRIRATRNSARDLSWAA